MVIYVNISHVDAHQLALDVCFQPSVAGRPGTRIDLEPHYDISMCRNSARIPSWLNCNIQGLKVGRSRFVGELGSRCLLGLLCTTKMRVRRSGRGWQCYIGIGTGTGRMQYARDQWAMTVHNVHVLVLVARLIILESQPHYLVCGDSESDTLTLCLEHSKNGEFNWALPFNKHTPPMDDC